jgi:hypothetical protein
MALAEMSSRKLPVGKSRGTRKADNLNDIYELSRNCGSLDVSQPYVPPWPVIATTIYVLRIFNKLINQ